MSSLPADKFAQILENYREICYNINEAKAKYRKSDDRVRLMAVTKTVAPELVNFVVEQGVDLLGENRVQEFLSKKDEYRGNAQVHIIGHLQTNKVKYIISDVSMIQSVDSVKLGEEINRRALQAGRVMDILVEVNAGNELSKSGVNLQDAPSLVRQLALMENIRVRGIMAIPPIGAKEEIYDALHSLYLDIAEEKIEQVTMEVLSVGMSGDYELAIKHGSNIVRIGTKLFGARY